MSIRTKGELVPKRKKEHNRAKKLSRTKATDTMKEPFKTHYLLRNRYGRSAYKRLLKVVGLSQPDNDPRVGDWERDLSRLQESYDKKVGLPSGGTSGAILAL